MKAIFLDRDGVINVDGPGWVTRPEDLCLVPGAAEAIVRLQGAGWVPIVITNQSGIGRGVFTEGDLAAVHSRMVELLGARGAVLAGIYYCPHAPSAHCDCRKPAPGLVARAAREQGIDVAASWFVGDKPSDVECGHAAGCRAIAVLSGLETVYDAARFSDPPEYVCDDLSAAADVILTKG